MDTREAVDCVLPVVKHIVNTRAQIHVDVSGLPGVCSVDCSCEVDTIGTGGRVLPGQTYIVHASTHVYKRILHTRLYVAKIMHIHCNIGYKHSKESLEATF